MVSVLGRTAVLNTLSVSGVSAGVLSCLTSNACQQGKPAGFTQEKEERMYSRACSKDFA